MIVLGIILIILGLILPALVPAFAFAHLVVVVGVILLVVGVSPGGAGIDRPSCRRPPPLLLTATRSLRFSSE